MEVPQKLKMEIPFDLGIPLLGIYPKKTSSQIQKDIFTPMFIATLFTVVKIWKQPKCSLVDEWIKKVWYIYTMEYYSAIRKKQIPPFATTWMELEVIVLSEISQRDRDNYQMISLLFPSFVEYNNEEN